MAHKYTKSEADFIKENIKGTTRNKLTEIFNTHFKLNLKVSQIVGFVKNNDLKSGLDGRFKTGRIAANKGMRGIWHEGSEKTWFKKGNTPHNHKPVGTERVTVDDYTEVKVAEPNKWQLKQRIVWEKYKGNIPKGYVIVFGDGNRHNLDINNLILVTRPQLAILNKKNLIQNDAELTRTGVIVADLYLKISEKKSVKI